MEFRLYSSAKPFLVEHLAFLEKQEAANNLILGMAFAIEKGRFPVEECLLFGVFDRDKVVFSGLQTPLRNLIIFGEERAIKPAIEYLWPYCQQKNKAFPGLIGPRKLSVAFAETWQSITSFQWAIQMKQRVFQLDRVTNIPFATGEIRLTEPRDTTTIADWLIRFHEEAIHENVEADAFERAQRMIGEQRLYVWEDQEIVSMAASARATRNGITVNAVFTPLEHRKKGYASSCVASLSQLMLNNSYAFCSLFTDAANPTSNKIYQRIGYREVAKFQSILFKY